MTSEDVIKEARDMAYKKSLAAGHSDTEKAEKIYYQANFPDLVDIVEDNGQPKFLTFDGEVLSERIIDGKRYLPPENLDWLLPCVNNVLEESKKHSSDTTDSVQGCVYCQKTLYPLVLNYFMQFCDPPTEYHFHFLAQMAFHSHLIEKFNKSPILFLVAYAGRGKTPTLKAMAAISRRGLFTETLREANLIRWASDYQASMFFDVKNFPKRVEISNSEDLIYGRAERGVRSSRVLYPEKGAFRDMVSFQTFGVTGATSNRMVDAITEARCVVFNMPLSRKVFNTDATNELGLPIKEKLTAFRMAHFRTPFVEVDKTEPGKLEDYLQGYQKMIKTIFPAFENDFLNFKKFAVEQKLERAENTFEARILKLVIKLQDKVEPGTLCLSYEELCDEYNKGKAKEMSPDTMSGILRSLGFKSKKNSLGAKRGIFYDDILIEKLKADFGLGTPPESPSEVSEASENGGFNLDQISTLTDKQLSDQLEKGKKAYNSDSNDNILKVIEAIENEQGKREAAA